MENFAIFCKRLNEYENEYGDLLVPYRYETSDGYRLGRYVHYARTYKDKLSEYEINMLNEMNFVWRAKGFLKNKYFEKFYKYLLEYKKLHGDCLVPTNTVIDGFSIGAYISKIRSGAVKLNGTQIKRLNDIGFVWRVKNRRTPFCKVYELLMEYVAVNDSCKIPVSLEVDGIKVGSIVKNMVYGRIKLNDIQKEMLKELGIKLKF